MELMASSQPVNQNGISSVVLENCQKSFVKTPILLNIVNLSTIICP